MCYLRTAASCSSQSGHSRQPGGEGTCHGLLAFRERYRKKTVSSSWYCDTVKCNWDDSTCISQQVNKQTLCSLLHWWWACWWGVHVHNGQQCGEGCCHPCPHCRSHRLIQNSKFICRTCNKCNFKISRDKSKYKLDSPFWMSVWERVNRPWTAVMCRGLFPSRLWRRWRRNNVPEFRLNTKYSLCFEKHKQLPYPCETEDRSCLWTKNYILILYALFSYTISWTRPILLHTDLSSLAMLVSHWCCNVKFKPENKSVGWMKDQYYDKVWPKGVPRVKTD